MKKENEVRIYNRLFIRLYLNYAIMLVITAGLIGLIFMWQFQNTTLKDQRTLLEGQAKEISNEASNYIASGKSEDYISQYVLPVMDLNHWDIYTISKPNALHPMDKEMETGNSYDEMLLMPEYKELITVVESAFQNNSKYKKVNNDQMDQVATIMYSCPIIGENNEVVGAVVVKKQVNELKAIFSDSFKLIIISIIVSLGISFIIVIVFATELSLPISRMRTSAMELAAGNYHSKTGINRKDEIGDLAKTVDVLSDKLLENDTIRKNMDQMRLDFFANVSHELRTPITVIRAYTETLADGVVQDEDKKTQYYNRMLSECKSMERLVGDLLILSKMQNPDFAIEKEPINLIQVFEDIIRSASAIAEKKKIAIEVENNSPVYMILGDYDRLRQMFMVILDNAIKFSEENKTVHIKLSKTDKIIVSIKDEGIGIEPGDLANIFQKFYKSNLRQNASGTGLGLAIAKQIAIKLDGTIDVNSTPGIGTEFIFTFPSYDSEF